MSSSHVLDVAVIEDNPAFMAMMVATIQGSVSNSRQFKFLATGFSSAEALLQNLTEGYNPAILFCDVKLPGISGLELATEVRAGKSRSQIIFCSSLMEHPLDAFYEKLGNSFIYYTKPMGYFEIHTALNYAARAWKQATISEFLVSCNTSHVLEGHWLPKLKEARLSSDIKIPEEAFRKSRGFQGLLRMLNCKALIMPNKAIQEVEKPEDFTLLWSAGKQEELKDLDGSGIGDLFDAWADLTTVGENKAADPNMSRFAHLTGDSYQTIQLNSERVLVFLPKKRFKASEIESFAVLARIFMNELSVQPGRAWSPDLSNPSRMAQHLKSSKP
ncbi:MAG: response regulator [Myxococcota bacterium]|nr:response regulator [Myxococcota bacterium]